MTLMLIKIWDIGHQDIQELCQLGNMTLAYSQIVGATVSPKDNKAIKQPYFTDSVLRALINGVLRTKDIKVSPTNDPDIFTDTVKKLSLIMPNVIKASDINTPITLHQTLQSYVDEKRRGERHGE